MREINLLESTPKTKKKIPEGTRSVLNKVIARQFDRRFFHSGEEKKYGYGNYVYDGRWKGVVEKLVELYGIDSNSSVLDIGCSKGFLLYELMEKFPGIHVAGTEVSEFAINNAMDGYGTQVLDSGEVVEDNEALDDARAKVVAHMILIDPDYKPWKLPYPDNSFDVVININTLHNLPPEQGIKMLREMIRVCRDKKNMFIQVDAYRNQNEREGMDIWNLTAMTALSEDDWFKLLEEAGYDGDYYWTISRLEDGNAVK